MGRASHVRSDQEVRRPGDSIDGASPTTRQARSGPGRSLARRPPVYSRSSEPAIPPVSQRPALGCLFEVVETLVLTILIFLGIQTFVAQPYRVQQNSMQDTLQPEQYVLVDKLTPRWAPYGRGDIIVFDPPESWSIGGGGVPLIKRVIGLPGDTVELKNGKVYVNGDAIDEPYVFEEDGVPQTTDPGSAGSSWVLPEGELLVMGDHRQDSADSRSFGPIDVSNVIGRAWLRYWPFDAFGVLAKPSYPNVDGDAASPGDLVPTVSPEPSRST